MRCLGFLLKNLKKQKKVVEIAIKVYCMYFLILSKRF